MIDGNPLYNTVPATAPGLEGIRNIVGDIAGGLMGYDVDPYVAPNQGVYEAMMAKRINSAMYRSMMMNTYGQFGRQLGYTFGSIPALQRIGGMAGLSPYQARDAMASGLSSFGSGFFGQWMMPLVDSALSGIGLTGGSMMSAMNTVHANRMSLLTPGTLLSPRDVSQQHMAMGAASAVSSLINGLMSQTTSDGHPTIIPNLGVTQGFNRERIANVVMRAASRGMFNSHVDIDEAGITAGGIADRLSYAAGGMDLSMLDFNKGDFDDRKLPDDVSSVLSSKSRGRMQNFSREFAHRMNGVVEAMAAMRDLTHEVDGIEEKLEDLTNGDWLRSGRGAFAARDAVQTLRAITMVHNTNPQQALADIGAMRATMREASGFDQSMLALGFGGGGMFGLTAQIGVYAGVEDEITARGIRNDPILSSRYRNQARQAMARNINSVAGRGAQVLAYARQIGAIDEKEARYLQATLMSGDRAVMGATLNRLFTTVFGSAEAGHRFTNDRMQMNNMQMAMTDEAGLFANQTIMRGSANEMAERGEFVSLRHRLDMSKEMLASAGMYTHQKDSDARNLVERAADAIAEAGEFKEQANAHANAFVAQFDARVKGGMKPLAALEATRAAFANNPLTAAYSEVIERSMMRTAVKSNNDELVSKGKESYQATHASQALLEAGLISNDDRLELAKMVREGNGKKALERVQGVVNGLDKNNKKLFTDSMSEFGNRYDRAKLAADDAEEAEKIVAEARELGISAGQTAEAYMDVVNAANRYFSADDSKKKGEALIDLYEDMSKSGYAKMYGDEKIKYAISAAKSGDTKFFAELGRRAAVMQRMDVGVLQENGYGLQMKGFWGEGLHAGGYEKGVEARNELLRQIGKDLVETQQVDSVRSTSIAQDILSLFMGDRDFKGLLRMYDTGGRMESMFSDYTKSFEKLQKARETAKAYTNAETSEGQKYRAALDSILSSEGGEAKVQHLQAMLAGGVGKNKEDREVFADWLDDNGYDYRTDEYKAIMGYVNALSSVSYKQNSLKKELRKTVNRKGFIDTYVPWMERKNAGASSADGLLKDQELSSYIQGLDKSKFAQDDAEGRLRKAFSRVKGLVKRDEAAKIAGVKSPKDLSDQQWLEVGIKEMYSRAANGDEDAHNALRSFKAASVDNVHKVTGKLILESGNDSSPTTLEGTIGGSLQ